jgi:signal transduction histidine kinase
MQSLFFKIVLWFWLAMGAVLAAFIASVAITQTEPVYAAWREATAKATAIYAQSAVEVYEREGREGLSRYFERVEHSVQLHPLLFDERGHEVLGKRPQRDLSSLLARARTSDRREFLLERRDVYIAYPALSARDKNYVLVLQTTRPFPFGDQATFRAHFFRAFLILLTAGALCYWLARYLTNPIARLRAATRQFAGGDLSVRVGSSMGKRRDEIAELGRDFDQMAERIESLLSAQRRLLSDISHELRSPLARLNVALELARQRAGEEAQGVLARIEREAERLNEMIGQLLTLSRLETGAQTLARKPVDLARLVKEVAEDADFEARSLNRQVKVNEVQPCIVNGSEELLRSALENVVRNGVRHTAEQTAVELTLRVDPATKQGMVTVRDHGAGVPTADLERIFQPFYRVDAARDRRSGGVGLGLAITWRAVNWHSGTVRVENARDGGLRVCLSLPLAAENGERRG